MSAGIIWFLVGGAFLLSELVSPVFVLFFFGLGAWAAGLVTLFTDSLPVALGVFSVVAVSSLVLLRRVLVRTFTGRTRLANNPADEAACMHIGKLCTVTKAIEPPHPGEVSLGGSYWRAVAERPVAEGMTVIVLGHVPGEELTLRVHIQETDEDAKASSNDADIV